MIERLAVRVIAQGAWKEGGRTERVQAPAIMGSVVDLRALYLDSCSTVLDLIGRPEVDEQWLSPSVLPELSVGALAAHLGRALLTVDAYVQDTALPDDAARVDAAGYLVAALGEHDPVDSEFHQAVRQRGESAAEVGQHGVLDALVAAMERLNEMPVDMTHRIAVLGGLQIELGEYLKTRLVEIAVHCRDLADSLEIDPPEMSDDCWTVVTEVVVAVAVLRNEQGAVALALSRADRFNRVVAF